MKTFNRTSMVSITVLLTLAGSAYAQQPPDVVQSDGRNNTAMGTGAMAQAPGDTYNNTAVGYNALFSGPGGGQCCGGNTAVGSSALSSDTSGAGNTGVGNAALTVNDTGIANSAFGNTAMYGNTSGSFNTALGNFALRSNSIGNYNTAAGMEALNSNTTGGNNTASGWDALYSNTTGASNTATGHHALSTNDTGFHNTGDGAQALFSNTTGASNTALGLGSLFSNTTGSNNVAVGINAGYNLTTGNANIDLGNNGVAGESGTIRLGTAGTHAKTYIAGISSAHVTGAAVYVTSSGQLGVLASSERYKTAIEPMGEASAPLQQLRPVTFHLKAEPQGALQYGLIAEEVSRVYPDLVIRDDDGMIQGVRYDELAPLLLNEVQQQHAQIATQAADIRDLRQQLAQLQELKQEMLATLQDQRARAERFAQR